MQFKFFRLQNKAEKSYAEKARGTCKIIMSNKGEVNKEASADHVQTFYPCDVLGVFMIDLSSMIDRIDIYKLNYIDFSGIVSQSKKNYR